METVILKYIENESSKPVLFLNQYREQLIKDFFSIMRYKKYAAIKFPDIPPEELSVYSDIDLCIDKKDFESIMGFLKQHKLVNRLSCLKKSYMACLQIVLKDGSLLGLDLIWKFQRKSLVFMNAENVLKNSFENIYGVFQIDPLSLAKYIGWFYGLNRAKVPLKYKKHVKYLWKSKTDESTNLLIRVYTKEFFDIAALKRVLRRSKKNNFLNTFFNSINYVVDLCKEIVYTKGMVIAFSGVQGSEKTTIVEKVKHEINKKIRKRVIILKHGPNILPFLNRKIKASTIEKQNVRTISIKEKKRSFLNLFSSSSYYYMDYFLGQFYIYFRYVLRGYVVLYDGYYFDFIYGNQKNDLRLSKHIISTGYEFLFKPEINVLIHTDNDKIGVHNFYTSNGTKTAFEKLNTTYEKQYYAIKNEEIKYNIDLIVDKIVAKAI